MPAPRKYPNELRERSQRMVAESMSEDPALTLNGAVKRIGPRVGVVPETLRGWVKQAAIDAGQRPGVSTVRPWRPGGSWHWRRPSPRPRGNHRLHQRWLHFTDRKK